MTNWETLTILAHQIAHHLNYHLVKPHPYPIFWSMELEADETAGFILYKLGATLEESQRAMRSAAVSIEGSYTHPPRSQRLEAIKKGWEKAVNKITDIDGNQYDVIKIGNQIWMKENLKVSKYRNGEDVPTGLEDNAWYYTKKGAYAIHLNNNANNSIYGKEYNWFAVSDSRGLCPSGWHIPSDSEWTTLTNYLGGESVAGGKMKSTGTTLWSSPNTEATNESSFSVLPGGCRAYDGGFNNISRYFAFFWSATETDSNGAMNRSLVNSEITVMSLSATKSQGASVRCLRD